MLIRTAIPLVTCCAALFATAGCNGDVATVDYVARVGDQLLTTDELAKEWEGLKAVGDSIEVNKMLIDRWIDDALLADEARRQGLADDEEISGQLRQSERRVLATALISRMYESDDLAPSEQEVADYYAAHVEELRIQEPYVRVRYLTTATREDANSARRLLQRALRGSKTDSLWQEVVGQYAQYPEASAELAERYYPESRLFSGKPQVRDVMTSVREGVVSLVVETVENYFFLQVADRAPVGTVPDISWIEDEIRRQLILQKRKQVYARNVEQLRAAARARNSIEIK